VSEALGRIFDAPFSRIARTWSRISIEGECIGTDRDPARGSMAAVSDLNKEPLGRINPKLGSLIQSAGRRGRDLGGEALTR
jgi:hypothetical protein